ncbi:MAG: HlyD family efflux transporter periplasmic adaptor subunit [Phycisphaerae bacterium]|nr:HlyD family efflux transporter periplasmic adaptor subunit [Phycisphaerae bacterium]
MGKAVNRGILICVAAGVVWLLYQAFMPKPMDVDVAPVRRGDLFISVEEDGRTRIRERYTITAPLIGRLLRIQLDPGDNARAGQTLLAAIEPRDPDLLDPRARAESEARVKAARAALGQAEPEKSRVQALLEQATGELERVEELSALGTASDREVRDAKTLERVRRQEFNAARFAQQIAAFQLELAEAALAATRPSERDPGRRFEIRAPCDGRVLRVYQESAGIVTPGTPLLEFGDPSDLECVVDVLSVDAVRIKPGNAVAITGWGGDHPLRGSVRVVEPAGFTKVSALGVEEQRVNVILDFTDPPEARAGLGDGYRVDAGIVVDQRSGALIVPTSALFRDGDRWAVYRVVEGRAVLTRIRIGGQTDLEAEVTDGIDERDSLIVHPSDTIADGVAVRPRGEGLARLSDPAD